MKKKIAVITSGGDAPGMNSFLFGLYSGAMENNMDVFAFVGGFDGIIDNNIVKIDFSMLDGKYNRGGSAIKSGRSKRFLTKKYFNIALSNLKNNKIDVLVVVGGDGSLKGSEMLKNAGVNIIGVPATIDNDLTFTYTLGYDTATNNIVNAVDIIMDSLSAFNYGAVIKIMGNTCPNLINNVKQSLHTEYVLLNKQDDINKLAKNIKSNLDGKHLPPVVLVLEDCFDCQELAKTLQEKCKINFRPHIIGYIQRGGTPSAFDRKYGYNCAKYIIDTIKKGKNGFVVGYVGEELCEKDFKDCYIF